MPKVDRIIYDPAKIKLDVYYTAKTSKFHCTYTGKLYEHTDVTVLKQEVLAAIKAAYALEWLPVVEIVMPGKFPTDTKLSLEVERKYIGFHPNLGYKQCHWTAQPEQRLAVSQSFPWHRDDTFSLPDAPAYQERAYSTTIWLPYSDATWEELQVLCKYLLIVKQRLQRHLIDASGVHQAVEIGRLLFDHFATQNGDASRESENEL